MKHASIPLLVSAFLCLCIACSAGGPTQEPPPQETSGDSGPTTGDTTPQPKDGGQGDQSKADESSGKKPCGSTGHGETEERIRYRASLVPSGESCEKETQVRTCQDGEWSAFSGSYTHDTCVVQKLDLPLLSFKTAAMSITEGDPGAAHSAKTPRSITIEITASKAPEEDTEIRLTFGGDAVMYQDFQPDAGRVILAKGQTTASVKLWIVRDTVKEATKKLAIGLAARRGLYQVDGGSLAIELLDDDSQSTASPDGCNCVGEADEYVLCSASQLTHMIKTNKANNDKDQDAVFDWSFDAAGEVVYCGRFLSGDYWLASRGGQPIQLTKIAGSGAGIGAELDPTDDKKAASFGAAAKKYGNYDATKDLTTQLPYTIPTGRNHVILAGLQRDSSNAGCGTKSLAGVCVDAYHFLTVLQAVPEGLGRRLIRPGLTSDMKTLLHFDRDFNVKRLVTSKLLTDKKWTGGGFSGIRKTWIGVTELFTHHSEGGRGFRAHTLVDDYASGLASRWFGHMSRIMSADFPLKDKEQALASMLSFGQDNYHIFQHKDGPRLAFGGGAGQGSGRIMPVLLFGLLRSDPAVSADVASIATEKFQRRPQEYKQLKENPDGEALWGDGTPFKHATSSEFKSLERRYWTDLQAARCYDGGDPTVCATAKGGKKTTADPYQYIDGPAARPGRHYFGINVGIQTSLATFLYLSPQLCDVTNYDRIVKFATRVKSRGVLINGPDPCAPPDPREPKECGVWRDEKKCKYYRVTWGPDPKKPGDCIRNNSGGNTGQKGRFSLMKTTYDAVKSSTYKSYLLLGVFEKFRDGRDSCRGKTKGAKPTTTAAQYNAQKTRLTWQPPTSWDDGKAFDPAIHLGAYRVSYRKGPNDPWQSRDIRENSLALADYPEGAEFKLEACDFLNICSPIQLP